MGNKSSCPPSLKIACFILSTELLIISLLCLIFCTLQEPLKWPHVYKQPCSCAHKDQPKQHLYYTFQAENRGIVMVNFYPGFLCKSADELTVYDVAGRYM